MRVAGGPGGALMGELGLHFLAWLEKCLVKLVSIGALGLVFTLCLVAVKRIWQKHLHSR